MGSRFRLTSAFTWFLLAAAACIPAATAARFEIRNEIAKYPGRYRKIYANCWSENDRLGRNELGPGQAKSWSFTPVFLKIPFLYTKFQCTFFTIFSSPYGQTATVFEGERNFRRQCDNPKEEECIWVVKRKGLYQRKISRDVSGQKIYQDELKLVWFGGKNYNPHEDDS